MGAVRGRACLWRSSMGALRAAELDSFGMTGVGRYRVVSRWRSRGRRRGRPDPRAREGVLVLSEPMVTRRATCEAANERDELSMSPIES